MFNCLIYHSAAFPIVADANQTVDSSRKTNVSLFYHICRCVSVGLPTAAFLSIQTEERPTLTVA